ncbi:DUF4244 domain-containing protein [Oerskovia sp. Sa2CUA9]|uniref:DUF4244 domain-containing protein n=2 Tax=Cellulomonadaceae TaxID=85016 RepID=A0ABR8TV01_9CELL|nr:DUF4244 domain-containing protein [Oerskovia merdavium]
MTAPRGSAWPLRAGCPQDLPRGAAPQRRPSAQRARAAVRHSGRHGPRQAGHESQEAPMKAMHRARATGAGLLVRVRGDDPESGLATAEYAVATIAAVGFAGLLIAILKSGEVREMLLGIIQRALSIG